MPTPAVSIVNVGYRSTNYWVISAGRSRVLVDLGWPGTIGTMRANLGRADIPLQEIRYALATHYHIDHAGVAQDLKDAGVPLLVIGVQVPFIPLMKRHIKAQDRSRPGSSVAGARCVTTLGRLHMSHVTALDARTAEARKRGGRWFEDPALTNVPWSGWRRVGAGWGDPATGPGYRQRSGDYIAYRM